MNHLLCQLLHPYLLKLFTKEFEHDSFRDSPKHTLLAAMGGSWDFFIYFFVLAAAIPEKGLNSIYDTI